MPRGSVRTLGVAALLLVLAGCVHARIDETAPSIETLKILRAANVPPMAVGAFVDAGGAAPVARTVVIRGSTMSPPKGASFAEFLGLSFENELRTANRFDPGAPVAIAGRLIESRAGETRAALGVRISVIREGTERFAKDYRVETTWKGDFIGALAIPEAFRQYNALYPLLVRQVFSDPAFVEALKSP
ncbi:hypothetical protein ASD67_08095 [Sphingopyxis sp. Root1497]|uniref:hypothetical protein n=1 Tax=Sphingopyxis sp. Root1497 TaxID=1736474 RepID=UPI0006F8ECEA|nr:hypothetical protein [Sphingopyxis sp. Root1497]KQZ64429.1 hypothetical protein ASD67_08095 [Sphingopyxis sp. Root1497]